MSSKISIIDYVIVFLLVLSGGGILFVFQRNLMITLLLLLVLVGALSKVKRVEKVYFNKLFLSLFIIAASLITIYIFGAKGQDGKKYVFNFITFFLAGVALVYFKLAKVPFVKILYLVLNVLMWHAIINFFIFPLLQTHLVSLTNDYNEYTYKTFCYLFNYMPDRLGVDLGVFVRNQGVFSESGVLQFFMNLLFFLEAFILRRKKFVLFLSGFAILSTYSTTGLVLLMVQVIILFWKKIRKNILTLPLILIAVIPLFIFVQNNVEQKFGGETTSSAQIRLFDLFQQLIIVKDHPITGVGLDPEVYSDIRGMSIYALNLDFIDFNSLERGSTNSILFLLGAGGIPFALYILWGLFKQDLIRQKKGLFLIILIISLMSEPILFKPFFLVFVMSGKLRVQN